MNFQIPKNRTSRFPKIELPDSQKSNFQIPKNRTSGFPKIELPDSQKSDFQIPKNQTSGFPKIELPDSQKPNSNNTDISNTDISNTDISNTDISNTDISNTDISKTGSDCDINNTDIGIKDIGNTDIKNDDISINPISAQEQENTFAVQKRDLKGSDWKKIIRENIGYASLTNMGLTEELDGIVDLIVDVVSSKAKYIRISHEARLVEDVKERFLALNNKHMTYVLGCLKRNHMEIRNMRSYLLATLYNATTTCAATKSFGYPRPSYGCEMGEEEREAIRRLMGDCEMGEAEREAIRRAMAD